MADLLIAKPGQSAAAAVLDNALRSNYLLAIAFGFVTGAPARRAVAAALRYLFVPGALRTLAPLPVWPPLEIRLPDGRLLSEPREPYRGRYEGDEDTRRKPAYHNGTAWTWTLPTACEALVRAWDSSPAAVAAAKAYLGGMDRLMMAGCLGQMPEILDGDAPHQPRGCDAQAWSALEALRVWKWLNSNLIKAARQNPSPPASHSSHAPLLAASFSRLAQEPGLVILASCLRRPRPSLRPKRRRRRKPIPANCGTAVTW